jgi:hypothetical protein
VALEPFHDVEAFWRVELHSVAVEEVGNYDEIAIGGELVGNPTEDSEIAKQEIQVLQGSLGNSREGENHTAAR